MYFHIRGYFFSNFLHQLLEKSAYLKKNVNLQGLFVLTVGYVDIKTYIHEQSITILLKEYILFMFCLYYSSVHFHSFCFYIQYPGGIREITSMVFV